MNEPTTLIEDVSPNGNVQAVAESDGRAVHFYLFAPQEEVPGQRMRGVWVRNLAPAPAELDVTEMRGGRAPMMPAGACAHPAGLPVPTGLRVVWFEEGNAAALLDGDDVLAVLPPWSGYEGFTGYARDCTAESPLSWPLTPDNVLHDRVRRADASWRAWDDPDLWPRFSRGMIERYRAGFGAEEAKYYAIDGGKWPPKAALRFDLSDRRVMVTVGVSVRPMPMVEMSVKEPAGLRRVELAAAFPPTAPDAEVLDFGRYLSGQSGYPWERNTWLGHGHTMPCDSTPRSLGGGRFPAVLWVTRFPGVPELDLPAAFGDPVNVLWAVPVAESEREYAEANGSEALIERLVAAGPTVVHTDRPPVA